MLYLILLLPLALAALSLIRNDRARTVILAAGQVLLLALLIGACTLGDMATPVWHMTADLTFSLRLDGLGRFFCLLTAVCWLLTIPYASVYMTHEGHHPRFYAFLMLTEAAVLGAALAEELGALGLHNAHMDEFGYVYAWLPATAGCEGVPCVGLIAHMDTSPEASGADVKPRIVHY